MDLLNEIKDTCQELFVKRIDLELRLYSQLYPSETFVMPEIVVSYDFHREALNIYRDFGYPKKYIAKIDCRANWDTTVALTIFNQKMFQKSKIIINVFTWRDDTVIHELTHVSDYYNYCRRNNKLELSYLEFLSLDDFQSVYLLSEFRAFFRGAKNQGNDLKEQLSFEMNKFNEIQCKTIENQNIEAYYYHLIRVIAFYCAYIEKFFSEHEINKILSHKDENLLHLLFKFLYPLRNKTFETYEKYFDEFKAILDKFIAR